MHELQRREKERGDREIGNAEWQFPILHPQDTYDITVDTFENSAEECTDQIIEMLEKQESMKAFKILKSRL